MLFMFLLVSRIKVLLNNINEIAGYIILAKLDFNYKFLGCTEGVLALMKRIFIIY